MPKIDIRGNLVPNNYKWYYDVLGMEATCPKDVQKALNEIADGDDLEVYINSPGGVIDVGSEIYTMLREIGNRVNMTIKIVGEACSAASIVAMAGHCLMSPTALMMVHCVSTEACGNHSDMEHVAEVLCTADKALCQAYVEKTGMSEKDALEMMEHETWLTAQQAKEKGMIDGIMFDKPENGMVLQNAVGFELPTKEMLEKAMAMFKKTDIDEKKEEGNQIAKLNCRMVLLNLSKR